MKRKSHTSKWNNMHFLNNIMPKKKQDLLPHRLNEQNRPTNKTEMARRKLRIRSTETESQVIVPFFS